jgi:hypothetical protein
MRFVGMLAVSLGCCVAPVGGMALLNAGESPDEQASEQASPEPTAVDPSEQAPNADGAIPQSDDWRTIMHEFDEWASVQQIYDSTQVARYRQQLVQRESTLRGAQRQDFLDDLSAKLKILSSAEARKAREWLAENLAVASDSYAKKIKSQLPDVARLTASQLQEQLDEFQDRRAQTQAGNAEFSRFREQQVANIQAERRRQEAAVAQADARAQSDSYSGYHPGSGGYRGSIRTYSLPSSRWSGGWGGGWGGWGGYRW